MANLIFKFKENMLCHIMDGIKEKPNINSQSFDNDTTLLDDEMYNFNNLRLELHTTNTKYTVIKKDSLPATHQYRPQLLTARDIKRNTTQIKNTIEKSETSIKNDVNIIVDEEASEESLNYIIRMNKQIRLKRNLDKINLPPKTHKEEWILNEHFQLDSNIEQERYINITLYNFAKNIIYFNNSSISSLLVNLSSKLLKENISHLISSKGAITILSVSLEYIEVQGNEEEKITAQSILDKLIMGISLRLWPMEETAIQSYLKNSSNTALELGLDQLKTASMAAVELANLVIERLSDKIS